MTQAQAPGGRYIYRVKIRRDKRWYDLGLFGDPKLAKRVADQWGMGPGNSLVSSEIERKDIS